MGWRAVRRDLLATRRSRRGAAGLLLVVLLLLVSCLALGIVGAVPSAPRVHLRTGHSRGNRGEGMVEGQSVALRATTPLRGALDYLRGLDPADHLRPDLPSARMMPLGGMVSARGGAAPGSASASVLSGGSSDLAGSESEHRRRETRSDGSCRAPTLSLLSGTPTRFHADRIRDTPALAGGEE